MISNSWFNPAKFPIGGFQSDYVSSEYIVFGAALDETASYRPGCGLAPSAIREVASNLEATNIFSMKDISDSWIHDLGDIIFTGRLELFEKIGKIVAGAKSAGKKVLMLGGEHTVTAATADAFKDCLYVIFDAHGDLRDTYDNTKWSHACMTRRLLEHLKAEQIVQVGIRGISKEEIGFSIKSKIKQYYSHKISSLNELVKDLITRSESYSGVYLSVDMDVFDPAFVPGVGNPEPLGLTTNQVFSIVSKIPNIIGSDITELNPKFDQTGASQSVAARLALCLLSL